MWSLKLVAIFAISAVFASEERPFEGDKVLRITPRTEAQVELLKQFLDANDEIDAWTEPSLPGNSVDLHVPAYRLNSVASFLKENDFKYEVMINNVAYAIDEEEISNMKNAFYSGFDYEKYNSYSEIVMELQNLARKYPNAETFSVGRSYQGKNMVGLKIKGSGSSSSKPVVWIDGGIHAREWISPAAVLYFMNKLLTSSEPRIDAVLAKYDFYFLPVFNPDGYEFTRTSRRARMWRKTRSNSGWGCVGADPNRNWGHKFGGAGTSSNPCSDIYHGKGPFSEVEVAQVAKYLKSIPNLKSYYNVHAYSQLVLTPWSYTQALPSDYAEISRVGRIFANTLSQRYGTRYRVGPPSRILYAVAGGSIDWTYAILGVKYSYALELRDTGRYGFLLPASQIKPTGEETSDAWLAAIAAMR